MAATPVLGIDFGNESCFVAVARAGGIEVITNDYSLRDTPSCVAFTSKNRLMGTSAKNQVITNINNTVFAFKRILGLRFDDPLVEEEQKFLPYKLVQMSNGGVGVQVYYLGDEMVFSTEQIVAMLLTKLKEVAEAALECKVFDCVLAVPSFFTDAQRRALLDAAAIANIQVLRLLNEPSAAAVAYGLYRTGTDLPNPDQPARHVAFVDFGYSSLQVAIAAFHKGKVKMVAVAFDPLLGGRSIDWTIAHHMAKSFNKPGQDVSKNKRSWIRLLAEVDKLKRQMSANATTLPLNIECLIEERDFAGSMKRSEMEELCAPLLERVEKTLQRCLLDSGLKKEDVVEIELIGGSTRIPAVKNLIEKVFGKLPSTTLNQDECIARGAAIMAAMLSPNFKVREFSLTDLQPYAVKLQWGGEDVEIGDTEVFPKFHAVPFSKILTFYRKSSFYVSARYTDPDVHHIHKGDPVLGEFQIQGVKPGPEGEAQKVKVKVRLNQHGVFQVVEAKLYEKQVSQVNGDAVSSEVATQPEAKVAKSDNEMENMETETTGQDPPTVDSSKMDTADSDTQGGPQPAAVSKSLLKSVDLQVVGKTSSMAQQQLHHLVEREAELQAQDRRERDRIDSKNALEEFVLSIRTRVNDSEDLEPYIENHVREELVQLADDAENWLYDEGEDCEKVIYVQKLQQLQALAGPAQNRKKEHEEVPKAVEQLTVYLHRAEKALGAYRSGDAVYEHWTPEEALKLEKAINDKMAARDHLLNRMANTPKTRDLCVKAADFMNEGQELEKIINPVLNKPKPQSLASDPPAPSTASEAQSPSGEKMETE